MKPPIAGGLVVKNMDESSIDWNKLVEGMEADEAGLGATVRVKSMSKDKHSAVLEMLSDLNGQVTGTFKMSAWRTPTPVGDGTLLLSFDDRRRDRFVSSVPTMVYAIMYASSI